MRPRSNGLEPDPDASSAQIVRLTADTEALVRDARDRRRRVFADIASQLKRSDPVSVHAALASVGHHVVLVSAVGDPSEIP